MTERRVALETADIDVPAPPGVGFRPPLYFRVRAVASGFLRVELWELGKPHGARSVSSSGTKALEGRRIALAAAELARQLKKQRVAELAALEDASGDESAPSGRSAHLPLYAHFVWSAGARGAALTERGGWFAGPHMDLALAFDGGQRLTLGGAWLTGTVSDETARWLELRVALSQSFTVAPRFALEAGLDIAAAYARFAHADQAGTLTLDAASARAGLFARANLRLGTLVVLGLGPDLGVVLQPVTLDHGTSVDRMSGLWLGGTLSVSIDPEF